MKKALFLPMAAAVAFASMGCLDEARNQSQGCSITYHYESNWETFSDASGNVLYSAGAGAAHPDPCARAKFLGLY